MATLQTTQLEAPEKSSEHPCGRILYVQYTNPAAYPPLQHSSRIFADQGWRVLFLGSGGFGTESLRFPQHPKTEVRQFRSYARGWRQKLHYLVFTLWVVGWSICWQPDLVYSSDPLACPVSLALVVFLRRRIIYHEHDSPGSASRSSLFQRLVFHCRKSIARRAVVCIIPNAQRADAFRQATKTDKPIEIVWNCPATAEAAEPRPTENEGGKIRLLYHGSLGPERLPVSVIDALAILGDRVDLTIVGYETVGSAGYWEKLKQRAVSLAVGEQVHYLGPKPRDQMMQICRQCDVGLSFMPSSTTDINMEAMTGASNKPFEYLACGLALLVSDLPNWREMFVRAGYAQCCNPNDAESVANAIIWFLDNPSQRLQMGRSGRQRVVANWNYETQFLPVLKYCSRV